MTGHGPTQSIRVSVLAGVSDVPASAWDALVDGDDPFLAHAFLAALEGKLGTGSESRAEGGE